MRISLIKGVGVSSLEGALQAIIGGESMFIFLKSLISWEFYDTNLFIQFEFLSSLYEKKNTS